MASNTISGHQAPQGVVTPTASITHSWPCTERFAKDKHLEHYVCTKKDLASSEMSHKNFTSQGDAYQSNATAISLPQGGKLYPEGTCLL